MRSKIETNQMTAFVLALPKIITIEISNVGYPIFHFYTARASYKIIIWAVFYY